MNGHQVVAALVSATQAVESNQDLLCALDSEVGDGDHGVSMTIGMSSARRALQALASPTPESAFRAVGNAFGDEVGASSGVLYETGFEAAAKAVAGKPTLATCEDWAGVFLAITQAMQKTGGAEVGDKTMLDAWIPAARALQGAALQGASPAEGLRLAAEAAWRGVQQTKDLVAKFGRASRLGERARGHQDAGATSAYFIIRALQEAARPPAG